jgi:ferritin-like protein
MTTRTSTTPEPPPTHSDVERRQTLLELLERAYWMEIETVMSYLAASINPDGVRGAEVREALEGDVQEELGHARQFGERIKELWGVVPGHLRLFEGFLREYRGGAGTR